MRKCTVIFWLPTQRARAGKSGGWSYFYGTFGHVALRTYTGGVDDKGYYLSFYGAQASCACGLGNHFHTEKADELTFSQGIKKRHMHRLNMDLTHKDINVEKINKKIEYLMEDEKVWGVFANCADFVRQALVMGFHDIEVSVSLFDDKSYFLHTVLQTVANSLLNKAVEKYEQYRQYSFKGFPFIVAFTLCCAYFPIVPAKLIEGFFYLNLDGRDDLRMIAIIDEGFRGYPFPDILFNGDVYMLSLIWKKISSVLYRNFCMSEVLIKCKSFNKVKVGFSLPSFFFFFVSSCVKSLSVNRGFVYTVSQKVGFVSKVSMIFEFFLCVSPLSLSVLGVALPAGSLLAVFAIQFHVTPKSLLDELRFFKNNVSQNESGQIPSKGYYEYIRYFTSKRFLKNVAFLLVSSLIRIGVCYLFKKNNRAELHARREEGLLPSSIVTPGI